MKKIAKYNYVERSDGMDSDCYRWKFSSDGWRWACLSERTFGMEADVVTNYMFLLSKQTHECESSEAHSWDRPRVPQNVPNANGWFLYTYVSRVYCFRKTGWKKFKSRFFCALILSSWLILKFFDASLCLGKLLGGQLGPWHDFGRSKENTGVVKKCVVNMCGGKCKYSNMGLWLQ
jgi:hypothetical protein